MDNIGDILKNLSSEDIENLESLAQELLGDKDEGDSSCENKSDNFSPFLNPDVILKMQSLMGMMNKEDKRCNLICALKPNLSIERQKKADTAMEFIRLLDILPLLKDLK